MSTTDERIQMMVDLIRCSYDLNYTRLTPDFKIAYTTCPDDLTLPNAILVHVLSSTVGELLESGEHKPYFLDGEAISIIWIIEGSYCESHLEAIHVLGPIFYRRISTQIVRRALDAHNMSVPLRARMMQQLGKLPVIPSIVFNGYAPQLHYILTGERISEADVRYLTTTPDNVLVTMNQTDFTAEHNGVWAAEQALVRAFREGDPNYLEAINHSSKLSTGVKMNTRDQLRFSKDNYIVLLTLISRAAIEGGLNPSVSYSMNDLYMTRIENCSTAKELSSLSREMMDDYITKVQDARRAQHPELSRQIINCCDYIRMHIMEDLSISDLAERFGYTEYYFSHKFRKETGYSLKDFIKQQKLEQAKVMLSSTSRSIQDICDELNFGSRSFFSVSFREAYGLSPSEFREQNQKM